MHTDTERCVRAVQSKDARFDGWFFTAVTTTRIYCRPSCPVVPPKPRNMTFYPSAAACQQAGFRACKRCRPDTSPGSPEWNHRADLVARAVRLIGDGVVDRDGVPGLAARLGYSTRQIERQLLAELGAGPLALARAQRARTARLLIETTPLPMAEIAFAAGFSSIRAFNDTVREVFALSPSELRARLPRNRAGAAAAAPGMPGALNLRLPFRAPLTPDNLFGHLAATAVPGVEEWRDGAYRRTLRLPYGHGVAALTPMPDHIACRLALSDLRDLSVAISRCRRLLDLDADPVAVDDQLRTDPLLAPLVDKAPAAGCRARSTRPSSPYGRCWDSRSPRPPRAPTPPAWSPRTAIRSTTPRAASPTSSPRPGRSPRSTPSRSRCPAPGAPPSPPW
jgi:AraC family transcriptional regulator of adaptative response / DNA-3-methyladenine glycosylase II